jgi:hypothetical protein
VGYVSLFARYELEDFRKIANANSILYQLFGSSSWIFELNAQEKQDLFKADISQKER